MSHSIRTRNITRVFIGIVFLTLAAASLRADDNGSMILIQGAGGTPEYATEFERAIQRWNEIGELLKMKVTRIGDAKNESNDKAILQKTIESIDKSGRSPIWIVLVGHGTAYQDVAKFNLRGPDVSAKELQAWLQPIKRLTVLVNCSSSSGPFLKELANANRIIVTATKSGAELNYSRFAIYMSQAIKDLNADLDHDNQVSLLEAFLTASKLVQAFYDKEARLATEQALLDDNGDGFGTPATFFQGIVAAQAAKDGKKTDGRRAHQLILVKDANRKLPTPEQQEKRDQLELKIEALRVQKSNLGVDEYYQQLEVLMIELARTFQ